MPHVIVIGGGAAGLAAAGQLDHAGHDVTLLEASGRLGGRVHTIQTEAGPIELGAEFVHGKPPVLTQLIEEHGLGLEELDGAMLRSEDGQLVSGRDFFPKVMKLLDSLRTEGADRSFAAALKTKKEAFDAQTIASVKEYVSGFHAADINKVSEHALAKSTRAGEKEGSDEAFRLVNGYADIVRLLRAQLTRRTHVHLNAPVKGIDWKKGEVVATTARTAFSAEAVIITVPLPLWKSLRIRPDLPRKRAALKKLAMGAVIRVSLQFDSPWWHEVQNGKAKDLAFLFSHDPDFPTWWRGTSAQSNVLTGWSAAERAERLSSLTDAQIRDSALRSLARIFGLPVKTVKAHFVAAWLRNWQADPFIGGGYSYVLRGGDAAPRTLAAPVQDTIFVAGEATDFTGDNGTVHAAISSGQRAAREFLDSRR